MLRTNYTNMIISRALLAFNTIHMLARISAVALTRLIHKCTVPYRKFSILDIFFVAIRCGIPVIIMGETGCGKTRLIRFMCELQAGPNGPKNLLLMKVCPNYSLLFFFV